MYDQETGAELLKVDKPIEIGITKPEVDLLSNLVLEKNSPYSLEYPLNISAHRKRKILPATQSFSEEADSEAEPVENDIKLKMASSEYLPREKLIENKRKLNVYIQSFFNYVLKRLAEDPGELAQIIKKINPKKED